MNVDILILIGALVVFAVLAFKQISVLVLAPAITLVVFALMRMPVLENMMSAFMPSAANYIGNYNVYHRPSYIRRYKRICCVLCCLSHSS